MGFFEFLWVCLGFFGLVWEMFRGIQPFLHQKGFNACTNPNHQGLPGGKFMGACLETIFGPIQKDGLEGLSQRQLNIGFVADM